MKHSRLAAYIRLRDTDPRICALVVRASEDLAARHDLSAQATIDMKQVFSQVVLDAMAKVATDAVTMGFAPAISRASACNTTSRASACNTTRTR